MGLNEKPPGEEDEAMGMTMTQKILAAHAGLAEVKAGQLIEAELRTRILNQQKTANAAESLPAAMRSATILMWVIWESNTHFCRKKVWLWLVMR